MRAWMIGAAAVVALACSGEADVGSAEAAAEERGAATQVTDAQGVACAPMAENMEVDGRTSPYDSTLITIDGRSAKICYGRPALRGRTMIGGDAVPYGQLWRTGANEPTTLHLPFAASIAGIDLEPGSYSLYTIPGMNEWVVILNRSITQWGHESTYTDEVRAQEVGRGTAPATSLDAPVEVFTIRSEPSDEGATLFLEWQDTRVAIPVRAL